MARTKRFGYGSRVSMVSASRCTGVGATLLVMMLTTCVSPKPRREPAATSSAHRATASATVPSDPTPSASKSAELTPASADAAVEDGAPRVFVKARFVWVRPEPDAGLQWIGYLSTGESVKLRSDKPRFGPGCDHWYAIEPRGYVCVDGARATLDPGDAVYRVAHRYAPDLTSPWPHHYAESRGTPLYLSLPNADEQRDREPDLRYHLKLLAHPEEAESKLVLAGVDLTPATEPGFALPALPVTAYEARDRLLPRSTVAYSAEVLNGDRSFLLSADLRWLPKDRVVPYPRVDFSGLVLGETVSLPVALFRGHDRPTYRRNAEHLEPSGQTRKRLTWVELTDKSLAQDGTTYLETRDGDWINKLDAVVPHPMEATPWGARVGAPDTSGKAPAGRATWIEVSVWGGWLIAYEGTRPVFVTLISPGKGGTPRPGKAPIETASTPTGRFPISGKFTTATMEAPNEYIHSAVPWTQNFSGPYALHAAYWHDDWGLPKSGGCVNVSPKDGKWLFTFTEPALPEGWHGVRWVPAFGPSTTFIVHD